jgi:guanine deaminase
MYDEAFMQRAIAISRQALSVPGTEPFGAVIVEDGQIVGEGLNHSGAHFDPTSHGEIEAIRDACRRLERIVLPRAELYTSCEPCPLCVAAMMIAGIRKFYYGASLEQSDKALAGVPEALRPSVDITLLRVEAGSDVEEQLMPSEQKLADAATSVIAEWAASHA